MSALPLVDGFAADGIAGISRGRTLSASAFVAAAEALAQRLPAARCALLLCDDRLAFAVGLAAMALRRTTALLPPSRAAHALERISRLREPPYALVDRAGVAACDVQVVVDPWVDVVPASKVPAIAGDHVAVVVYTSGTTGDPRPHAKTWASLVRGAHGLGRRIGFQAGDAVIGAVPPQHMWGLEATVMLALQGGGIVHASQPLLPDDVAAAVAGVLGRCWLVATPLHIRSWLASGAKLGRMAGVLSATSPLEHDVAKRFEAAAATPVIEIYGATETGVIGTRHPAQEDAFTPLDGVSIAADEDSLRVRGAHLDGDVRLHDRVVVGADGRFTLAGRDADLVKIGGKRASLAMLNRELLAIDGVVDGAFVLLDTGGITQRLAALVVAPDVDPKDIVATLRDRIDAVFLPRPLHRVDALPRDALGKVSLDRLRECVASLSAARARALDRELCVPASHPALPGHFPGHPIVPAAWLLTLVAAACRDAFGTQPMRLDHARFRAPLSPGVRLRVQIDRRDDGRVSFVCTSGATRVADGVLCHPRAGGDPASLRGEDAGSPPTRGRQTGA